MPEKGGQRGGTEGSRQLLKRGCTRHRHTQQERESNVTTNHPHPHRDMSRAPERSKGHSRKLPATRARPPPARPARRPGAARTAGDLPGSSPPGSGALRRRQRRHHRAHTRARPGRKIPLHRRLVRQHLPPGPQPRPPTAPLGPPGRRPPPPRTRARRAAAAAAAATPLLQTPQQATGRRIVRQHRQRDANGRRGTGRAGTTLHEGGATHIVGNPKPPDKRRTTLGKPKGHSVAWLTLEGRIPLHGGRQFTKIPHLLWATAG